MPTDNHQRIMGRILVALSGAACDTLSSPTLMTGPTPSTPQRDRFPDVVAFSGERVPRVVFEVMEDQRCDELMDKLTEYQALPTIEEYVVVIDARTRWVRVHRRNGDALFVVDGDCRGGAIRLAAVSVSLDIDALYADLRPPVMPADEHS